MCRIRIHIQKNPHQVLPFSDFFKKQFVFDLNNFGQFLALFKSNFRVTYAHYGAPDGLGMLYECFGNM